MPKSSSPHRQRGHAGRAASARFVEVENVLPATDRPAAAGLIIEAEGLRLLLTDRAAVAILADLLEVAPARGKGGCP